jgi:hypothetical protein
VCVRACMRACLADMVLTCIKVQRNTKQTVYLASSCHIQARGEVSFNFMKLTFFQDSFNFLVCLG